MSVLIEIGADHTSTSARIIRTTNRALSDTVKVNDIRVEGESQDQRWTSAHLESTIRINASSFLILSNGGSCVQI